MKPSMFTRCRSILLALPGLAMPALAADAPAKAAIDGPPPLVAMVQAPGGFPRVPSEAFLGRVETLPIEKVRELANQGQADATVQLARLLWWNGNTTEPIRLLRQPAAAGVPVAQYLLATYLRGRDNAASIELLKEAALRGHATAQETLAAQHLAGTQGLERSVDQAFALYLQAGQQGLRNAQMNVGLMLCTGRGTAVDQATGRRWFLNSQQGQMMPLPPSAAGCGGDAPPAPPQ